ncbi:cache domain-containing protein [Bacillus gobiensis]|uniref:sensor histidine kinase n=1 Tax=Bacillus gobiensis TaxID=1441095 RepID=UPI003D25CDC1
MIGTNRLSHRFSTKIILILLLVILIPTLCTSISFYWTSNSVLKKNTRESTIQIAKQTADALSFIFNAGIDTSDMIYSDKNIQRNLVNFKGSTPDVQRGLYQDTRTSLNNIVYNNSNVKSVYVLKKEGKGWGSGDFSDYKLQNIKLFEQNWLKEIEKQNGEMVWQEIQVDRFGQSSKNTELVLPIVRVMKNFNTMDQIGFLLVNLNGRSILETIEQLKIGETGKFFVVNDEGKIMIDSNLNLIGKKVENHDLSKQIVSGKSIEFEFESNGEPYYGVKQPLNNGWMLVGTVPVHEITGQLDMVKKWILVSSGLFGLLAIVIGLIIARWVTNPVKQLTHEVMLVQQGNLKVQTNVRSSDEIGFLSKQINKMLREIEHLMKQLEEEQRSKFQAELRAVVHRIHPHFLYNTLGTLRWLVKANHNERAYLGLTALTRLLQANMAKSGNMITLEEELDIIRQYITVLELRYQKTFTLHLDIEPGTEKIIIPRMLLQPLVENAVFHGIVPKKQNGTISIQTCFTEENLEILVKDNGLGIEEQKLRQLNNPEAAVANGEIGIGLRHIHDMLQFHFKDQSEWSVTSEPMQGTTIHIMLKNIQNSHKETKDQEG